jgi:hypothetical protein
MALARCQRPIESAHRFIQRLNAAVQQNAEIDAVGLLGLVGLLDTPVKVAAG